MIVRIAALVALAGGVAHADDDPPSPQEVAARAAEPHTPELDTTFWPDRRLGGALYAQLDGDSRAGAGFAVGGELALGHGACGTLATRGEIAARVGPSTLTGSHVLAACIETMHFIDPATDLDLTAFPLRLEHELRWQLLPELAARRIVWNRPYTSERIAGDFALASIVLEGWNLLALPIDVTGEWWFQGARRELHSEIGASLAELRDGHDGSAIVFRGAFANDLDRFELVRFDRFPIPGTPLTFDAGFGTAAAHTSLVDNMTGRFGLGLQLGPVRAAADIERDYYATIDAALVGETRGTVALEVRASRAKSISISVFAARATLMPLDGSAATTYVPTYGVDLHAAWPIYRSVEARAQAGYGRSFYAQATDMAPAPQLGVIGSGQLLVRFEP